MKIKRLFLILIIFILIGLNCQYVLADEPMTSYMLVGDGEPDRAEKLLLFMASPAFGKWVSIIFLTLLAITLYLFLVIMAALLTIIR